MLGLAALALVAGPALSAPGQDPAAPPPDDARVRKAWSCLLPDERADAMRWLAAELDASGSYQVQCRDFVIEHSERDPGFWPAAGERPFFDPAVHAPAQPIPRRRLEPDAARARDLRARIDETRPPSKLKSGWSYDWTTGELRRHADEKDPERLFANALAGFPPDADLAEALVLQALDTGEERITLTAFEHAYTDREGNVFPCSLYEAWSSGVEIEMPDVDTIGIAHTALNKKKWVAPVAASKQKSLYDAIGKAFADARRYRGLREALAACYLNAAPVMWDGYSESLPGFHALWDKHAADPALLAKELPRTAKDWTDYLGDWAKEVGKDSKLWEAGQGRQLRLKADGEAVRGKLVWVLGELGAFERKEAPAGTGSVPAGGK